MDCPYCKSSQTYCINSRERQHYRFRRYECIGCHKRFNTRECIVGMEPPLKVEINWDSKTGWKVKTSG